MSCVIWACLQNVSFKNTYVHLLFKTIEIVVKLCTSNVIVVKTCCMSAAYMHGLNCCCSTLSQAIEFYSFQKILLSTITCSLRTFGVFNQSTAAGERAINTQMGILLTIIVVEDFNFKPGLS